MRKQALSEATRLSQGHKLVSGRAEACTRTPARGRPFLSTRGPQECSLHASVYLAATPAPETRISGEPDTSPAPTPPSSGQASSGQPYGQGRSPSAALPSANLWVAGEGGGATALVLRSYPTTLGRVPGTKTPAPPLRAAAPHVLRLVQRPGPRPRPPLAARCLPLLSPPPTRLGLPLHVTRGGTAVWPERAI